MVLFPERGSTVEMAYPATRDEVKIEVEANLFHICQKLEINQTHPLTLDFSLYKARIQKVVRLRQV